MRSTAWRFVLRSVGSAIIASLFVAWGSRTGLFGTDDAISLVDASTDAFVKHRDAAPTRDVQTPPPPPTDEDASVSPTCDGITSPPITTVPPCEKKLVVGDLERSGAGCFVDVVPGQGETGLLTYDCGGGGAKIEFARGAFTGTIDRDGTLHLCSGTSFPWEDGCTWDSAQHITGSIEDGTLRFHYAEASRPSNVPCLPPCSASATIVVE